MGKFGTILFDFDGTIANTGRGIVNAAGYALEKFGITVKDKTELYKFVGPPLVAAFEDFYGFTEEKAVKAVEYYREYYKTKGVFETDIYPGIKPLLKTLKTEGYTVAVATSKPEFFVHQISDSEDISKYFDVVSGATFDASRGTKEEVIRYALELLNKENADGVVMVGDRFYDAEGAKKCGIPTIGVLYGFGSEEELKKAGVFATAKTPEEVHKIILESN